MRGGRGKKGADSRCLIIKGCLLISSFVSQPDAVAVHLRACVPMDGKSETESSCFKSCLYFTYPSMLLCVYMHVPYVCLVPAEADK